jgi:hypothetical protein
MPDASFGLKAAVWFVNIWALLLCLGVGGTCTGEAWAYFGRVVYRDEEPKQFWRLVASHYLGGLFLIGYFLYKVYGL